eukprot:5716559-Prorocentrum_lima.AAC.1
MAHKYFAMPKQAHAIICISSESSTAFNESVLSAGNRMILFAVAVLYIDPKHGYSSPLSSCSRA